MNNYYFGHFPSPIFTEATRGLKIEHRAEFRHIKNTTISRGVF